MDGLEFDPTNVNVLKSTLTPSSDVAEAVYGCLQWSYQLNVDLKRNQIFTFIFYFNWKKRYMWMSQNQ